MEFGPFKDTIGLIITGFAGSITHILNKVRKGEKMTFKQHLAHLVISGFIGYLSYESCQYYGINGAMQSIIIGVASYSGIKIIDALDLFKPKAIYDLIIDFISFKISGGKK